MERGRRECPLHCACRNPNSRRLHSLTACATKPTISPSTSVHSSSMAPSSRQGQAHRRRKTSVSLLALAGCQLCALLLLLLLVSQVAASLSSMNLPDGIENILGFVPKSSFQCERDGYFGDIDNDCRLFHLCQRSSNPVTGRPEWRHWTYACGNQTMFNQLTLTCAFMDEAIPCRHASQFQYLNEVIHKPAEPFLTDADVTSGFSYYSNRIMSDGARARAFQDSELLAQIGGASQPVPATHSQANSNQPQRQQFDNVESPQLRNELNANQFQNQFEAEPVVASQQQQQQSFRFQTPQQPAQAESQSFLSNFGRPQQLQHSNQHQTQPAESNARRQLSSGQLPGSNFHFQHQGRSASASARAETRVQPQTQTQPQLQRQAELESPQANFQPLQSFQQQFAAAPAATPVQADSTPNRNEPPRAFEFSITTNHQSLAGATSQQQFFGPAQIPLQPSVGQNHAQEPNRADPEANRFGPRALAEPLLSVEPAQPAVGRLSPTEPTATTTIQALTQTALAQTQPPITTSVAPATSTLTPVPFITTQRLQLAQPTQATLASALAVTEATPRSQLETGSELATSQIVTTPRSNNVDATPSGRAQQQARRPSVAANSERSLPGFQSTRLSSLNRRASASGNETPLVMRRPQASPLPARSWSQHSQQAATPLPVGSTRQGSSSARAALLDVSDESPTSFMAGGDFWRRAFDSQLMAPKFEPLMLRRRV